MEDESTRILLQICELQKEQNELLRSHLLRLRYSVRTLLVVMTVVAVALGLMAWRTKPSILPMIPGYSPRIPKTIVVPPPVSTPPPTSPLPTTNENVS